MSENRKNVLIVEDETSQQVLLKRFFNILGYAVVGIADSPGQLQDLLNADLGLAVDIATIDAYVPKDGDGYRATAIVRNRFPEVSIIAVSGEESDHGDIYLAKPFTMAQLKEVLESL